MCFVSVESITHLFSTVTHPLICCQLSREKDHITFGNSSVSDSIKFLFCGWWHWRANWESELWQLGKKVKKEDIDFFFPSRSLIKCANLWHLTKKYLMAKLAPDNTIIYPPWSFSTFIKEQTKTRHCDAFNSILKVLHVIQREKVWGEEAAPCEPQICQWGAVHSNRENRTQTQKTPSADIAIKKMFSKLHLNASAFCMHNILNGNKSQL